MQKRRGLQQTGAYEIQGFGLPKLGLSIYNQFVTGAFDMLNDEGPLAWTATIYFNSYLLM